jgi:hypothetical protein
MSFLTIPQPPREQPALVDERGVLILVESLMEIGATTITIEDDRSGSGAYSVRWVEPVAANLDGPDTVYEVVPQTDDKAIWIKAPTREDVLKILLQHAKAPLSSFRAFNDPSVRAEDIDYTLPADEAALIARMQNRPGLPKLPA